MADTASKPPTVRVEFFKPSGKWYTTEDVAWTGPTSPDSEIHLAFAQSLKDHLRPPGHEHTRLGGMIAVCLEPAHIHSHPLMVWVDQAIRRLEEESRGG